MCCFANAELAFTDQVELSIQCPQPELVAWLKSKDILPQGYSPLGGTEGSNLREHEVIAKIAKKHNVHGATILLSWLIKNGINPLPKSVTPHRIEANFKSQFIFLLTFNAETDN